jgi:cell division protease FtsH
MNKGWFWRQLARIRGAGSRVVIAAVIVALAIGVGIAIGSRTSETTIGLTELSRWSANHEIASVRIEGERISVDRKDGEKANAIVGDSLARHDVVAALVASDVPVTYDEYAETPKATHVVLPLVLVFGAGIGLYFAQRKRARAHFSTWERATNSLVGFADVAGIDEAKESLYETVEFLRNPARFGRLGGRAPRGVLLTGDPGTGKTLLARAVASEAKVPFLSASGSGFQEVFVGVGAQRVRALFAEARRVAPCIIFIDEIDALGRARGKHADSGAADHDQTLNQLLCEMDGFDHTSGIVVMASTNRADVLDPALLRPGRFDRQVAVPLPDARGREEILTVHSRPIQLDSSVDLACVARGTPGFSGADLANLLNEAAILAAREGADGVLATHIDRARDVVMMGAERRGFMLDQGDRHATAVHEAGHVVVGVTAPHADPVHKVSILPRGRALGVTHSLPERDRLMYRREYLEDQLCLMMGGRAAEMIILGTQTAGAADDIQRAASLARKMVAELGMSELGPISLADPTVPHSSVLIDRVEETARKLVEAQLARACRMVEERRAEVDTLVQRLLDEETLDAEAIRACFSGGAQA